MINKNNQLARSSLDQRMVGLRGGGVDLAAPRGGWVRAVRKALGMSLEQLGKRLGVGRSTVLRLEQAEKTGRVQIDTLRRAAEALDCELHYVLVPRRPLEQAVAARRTALAQHRLSRTAHTMALEGQHDPKDPVARTLLQQAEESISDRELWSDPS